MTTFVYVPTAPVNHSTTTSVAQPVSGCDVPQQEIGLGGLVVVLVGMCIVISVYKWFQD